MKRLVIATAVLALAMSLMADTEIVGEYTWTYRINGDTAEVCKRSYDTIAPNFAGIVIVPSMLGGKPVTSIEKWAFAGFQYLTQLEIPISVTNIGANAFSGCVGLSSIAIPHGVTCINSELFYGCTSLIDVFMLGDLTAIGDAAFMGSGLQDIRIPESVTYIGNQAFQNCHSLTNIIVQDGIKFIGNRAFSGCDMLQHVAIPGSVQNVEWDTFYGCSKILDVVIETGVKSIGARAFENCISIQNVAIPSSLSSIESHAFYNCSNLAMVRFDGAPPITDTSAFSNVKSGAMGTYTAEHAAAWEAVIDDKGYWKGLKMQIRNTAYSITYNANGGIGTMDAQTFEEGKEQKLSKNLFKKDGYVFQGWATNSVDRANAGIVDCKDEALITVDSDMTLYAVWDNPPLTLTAESADWIFGSISLRCVDADTSGAVHSYSLSFLADNGEWGAVEGSQGVAPSHWSNVDGIFLRTANLLDGSFLTRLDGIKQVSYRVSDENGRVSEPCATRTRYGLFVGVGHYSAAYQARRKLQSGRVLSDLPGIANDTRRYSNLAHVRGGFSVTNLIETAATVQGVDGAFAEIAGKAKPGDICLFYVATHGDFDGNKAVIRLYDDDYSDVQLKNGVELLSEKDAAVVCILATCCSEALVRQSYPNVAVIAAANYQGSTTSLFDMILMDYGWRDGWAGTGDKLSFSDLASYVSSRYDAIFSGITFTYDGRSETWNVQVENNVLLSNILAGTRSATASLKPLPVMSNVEASQADYGDKIEVSWDGDADADWYFVFCKDAGNVACEGFKPIVGKSGGKLRADFMASDYAYVERSSEDSPVSFAIRAFNGSGVSSTGRFRGWLSQKRQIVFDARGGTLLPWLGVLPVGGKICASLDKGTVLGALPNASKDGVSCLYWYRNDRSKTEVVTEQTKVTGDVVYYAWWESPTQGWLDRHTSITYASNGDIAMAAAMTAANGCRTVGECYALGIDPEDPDDDLKIAEFKMKDGKPEITLNHTKDGSGNSFEDRVKILGKAELTDAEWQEVPPEGSPAHRFFKVGVEMP